MGLCATALGLEEVSLRLGNLAWMEHEVQQLNCF